jgi:DNA-binding response OmpR family regulator
VEPPNVPVIMITAYGDDATRKGATELGAAGLLPKPVDFGSLRREIDQRLERANYRHMALGGYCIRLSWMSVIGGRADLLGQHVEVCN